MSISHDSFVDEALKIIRDAENRGITLLEHVVAKADYALVRKRSTKTLCLELVLSSWQRIFGPVKFRRMKQNGLTMSLVVLGRVELETRSQLQNRERQTFGKPA